jgi:hypothetical protein
MLLDVAMTLVHFLVLVLVKNSVSFIKTSQASLASTQTIPPSVSRILPGLAKDWSSREVVFKRSMI